MSRSISSIVRVSRLTTLSFCGCCKLVTWAASRLRAEPDADGAGAAAPLLPEPFDRDASFEEPATEALLPFEADAGDPFRLL